MNRMTITRTTPLGGQMTIGAFIARLRELSPSTDVRYVFGGCPDMRVQSYRGYYDEAALGWRGGEYGTEGVLAHDLARSLELQINHRMEGWKGGAFIISRDTPLWCDNAGNCSSCAVVGVTDYGQILIEYVP